MSELQDFLDIELKKCNLSRNNTQNSIVAIGKQIADIRKEKGLTQKELAQKCGIQQSNISRLEKGQYNPSIVLLESIAEALDKKLEINII